MLVVLVGLAVSFGMMHRDRRNRRHEHGRGCWSRPVGDARDIGNLNDVGRARQDGRCDGVHRVSGGAVRHP